MMRPVCVCSFQVNLWCARLGEVRGEMTKLQWLMSVWCGCMDRPAPPALSSQAIGQVTSLATWGVPSPPSFRLPLSSSYTVFKFLCDCMYFIFSGNWPQEVNHSQYSAQLTLYHEISKSRVITADGYRPTKNNRSITGYSCDPCPIRSLRMRDQRWTT